jgi:hypothetical protein
MPCDTKRLPSQSPADRKIEVREAIAKLIAGLSAGTIRPSIGPTGGITFQGWAERETKRVTDVCGYRLVLATGSASAKAAIARAEALSGRSVSRQAIAAGHHAHGDVWHTHK